MNGKLRLFEGQEFIIRKIRLNSIYLMQELSLHVLMFQKDRITTLTLCLVCTVDGLFKSETHVLHPSVRPSIKRRENKPQQLKSTSLA